MSIDCEYTDEIVCPYCGCESSDSWEIGNGEEVGDQDCDECGMTFECRRDISVKYVSRKKAARAGEGDK